MQSFDVFWRGAERLILGAGARQGISVLVFHHVLERRDPLRPNEPTKMEFESLVRFLAKNFNVVALHEGIANLADLNQHYHSVAVTFDDGYADNLEVAMPILARYGVPTTFFIASGLINGGLMWNDRVIESVRATSHDRLDLTSIGLQVFETVTVEQRRDAIRTIIRSLKYRSMDERDRGAKTVQKIAGAIPPKDIMMSEEQLMNLAQHPLVEIGGHTLSHPILTQIETSEAVHEIEEGKRRLELITKQPLRCFAYPNGVPGRDYDRRHVEIVRSIGFDFAVTTSPGGVRSDSDRYQLPRFTPWDRHPWRFALRMLQQARRDGDLAG